jgi:hypothetical protein
LLIMQANMLAADRVGMAGVTRHPSHTTGQAVCSHPAIETKLL